MSEANQPLVRPSLVRVIAVREFQGLFFSPVFPIVSILFLLLCGVLFIWPFFDRRVADLREFFIYLPLIFSVVIPLITMRFYSEEFSTGRWEMFATLPVRSLEIVLGKFFAGFVFVAVLLAPTLLYPLWIQLGPGDLEFGPILGGYLAALFLGAAYTAIGCLVSSLTRNQIVSALVAAVVCFGLWLLNKFLVLLPAALASWIAPLSSDYHFESAARGVLDARDLLYFASVVFLALWATKIAVEEKSS